MRLYEFTNPSQYLLPETDTADLVNQSKKIKTGNTGDDIVRPLRQKTENEKTTDTL
jgi:hypothetical protein